MCAVLPAGAACCCVQLVQEFRVALLIGRRLCFESLDLAVSMRRTYAWSVLLRGAICLPSKEATCGTAKLRRDVAAATSRRLLAFAVRPDQT
jgi:hypothetical protein